MNNYISFFSTILLAFFLIPNLSAQQNYTLSGYVKDDATGETLPFANVYLKSDPTQGTTTNVYGFYSLTITEGNYTVVVSYLGYGNKELETAVTEDKRINVELSQGVTFEEVVVTAEEEDANVQSTVMGTVELPVDQIK